MIHLVIWALLCGHPASAASVRTVSSLRAGGAALLAVSGLSFSPSQDPTPSALCATLSGSTELVAPKAELALPQGSAPILGAEPNSGAAAPEAAYTPAAVAAERAAPLERRKGYPPSDRRGEQPPPGKSRSSAISQARAAAKDVSPAPSGGASRTQGRLLMVFDGSGAPKSESAPDPAGVRILRPLAKNAFEVAYPKVPSAVLKANAETTEGEAQMLASKALAESGVNSVRVPRPVAEYDFFSGLGFPVAAHIANEANRVFLLMETAPGISLHSVLKGAPLARPLLWRDLQRLKRAVELLHDADLAHRDLDPLNILVSQIGARTIFHIIDWGYARLDAGGRAKALDRENIRNLFRRLAAAGLVRG